MRECRVKPTNEERIWWARLEHLWAERPDTMLCHADGCLHGVDRQTTEALDRNGYQPLELPSLPGCDGGDAWDTP